MSRSLPEWCGKTPDEPVPTRVKVRVFFKGDGRCKGPCGRKMSSSDKWDTDHIVAICNGGKNTESNLQTLCSGCHAEKTKTDVAIKAKTYAKQKAHLGLKKSRQPFRGWRKFNGKIVFADE